MDPLPAIGDVLVLAGDIFSSTTYGAFIALIDGYVRSNKPIFYVPGNHEFYGTAMPVYLRNLRRRLKAAGVTLLHNRVVSYHGVRFFGTTLWTDYLLDKGRFTKRQTMDYAARCLADHRCIGFKRLPNGGHTAFTPEHAARCHAKSIRLMREKLRVPYEGKTVVITHHGPHPKSVAKKYVGDALNGAFISDLSELIEDLSPTLWSHGHTHSSVKYTVGKTQVVANPRGYPRVNQITGEFLGMENSKFNSNLIISV